jgi:hypothetical protein
VTLDRFCRSRLAVHPRWAGVLASLAVTGGLAERLAATVVVAGAAGLLGPPVLWLAALPAGSSIPAGVPIVVGLLAAPVCAGMPLLTLAERAKDRRRHFRAVVGSTVDLVVLSLAGGMGIEGALLAATQLSPDWASRHMSRVLLQARDSGQSPWHALGLVLLAHAYLAPFGTAQGQEVLAVVGMLYAAGLTLMVTLARPRAAVRLLGRSVVER